MSFKWNDSDISKLIKLRNENKTWEELTKEFPSISANGLRKAFYRYIKGNMKHSPALEEKPEVIKSCQKEKTHIVIPDCQVKSGVDLAYLTHIGMYIAEKKPDVIVCIGDFADMPALSLYDIGKKSFEGRRYKSDIEATVAAMNLLMEPIRKAKEADPTWDPELHLTLGNHEHRIERCINSDPKLDGTISMDDLQYESFGWRVHPYLKPVMIDGIAYCHYFTSGVMGRPVSSAKALVQKKHMSCVMGHVQNWEMHREVRGDGKPIMGLFVGSSYTHDEDYLGEQGNNYSRQIWVFHEVKDGSFLPKPVSLEYLKKKYN